MATRRGKLASGSDPPGKIPVRPLASEEAEGVLEALSDAFEDYPVMRYVLGDKPGYPARLRTLIGFFVQARRQRGEPVLGIVRGAEILAVALVSDPGGPPSPPALQELRERVWRALGGDEREKYEAFSAACTPLLQSAPRLHLNMIGVRRSAQGAGLGRALLEEVHLLSERSSRSTGVSLTTESERNLTLYERAGYSITGHAVVSRSVRTWALFRPDDDDGRAATG